MGLVRVTAEVVGGVVAGGHPIHLDGILAWVWSYRHGARPDRPAPAWRTEVTRSGAMPQRPHLPLRSVCALGSRVWCASGWSPMGEHPAPTFLVKRRDDEDVHRLAMPFTPGSGPARNTMQRVTAHTVQEIQWLAFGQPKEIRHALACVGFIGGVRRAGFGEVTAWRVEAADVDPMRLLVDQDGRAARHLPVDWATHIDGPVIRGGIEPPYFVEAGKCAIIPVGTRAELHAEVVEALRAAVV